MDCIVFILLMAICLGLVYIIHKYFEKEQFYLLSIIYVILSFILSFKLINILGININANIIFSSGLIMLLYYFVNRYSEKESRRLILITTITSLIIILFLVLTSLMLPSIYDNTSIFYRGLVFENLSLVILYPISQVITMFLSEYCFRELKKDDSRRNIKIILALFGIIFIDVAIFIYFSYSFIINFNTAIEIAIDNYLVKVGITIIYILIINRLFMVRKVK